MCAILIIPPLARMGPSRAVGKHASWPPSPVAAHQARIRWSCHGRTRSCPSTRTRRRGAAHRRDPGPGRRGGPPGGAGDGDGGRGGARAVHAFGTAAPPGRRRMARTARLGRGDRGRPGGVPRLRRLRAGRRADLGTTRGAASRSSGPTSSEAADGWPSCCARSAADVLTIYDPAGGYGHPDHVQVHEVGVRAARAGRDAGRAGGDRRPRRAAQGDPAGSPRSTGSRPSSIPAPSTAPTPRARRSPTGSTSGATPTASGPRWRAHASQASADTGDRTLAALLRLPRPLYRRVVGREWFVEHGRSPQAPPLDDVFATMRSQVAG